MLQFIFILHDTRLNILDIGILAFQSELLLNKFNSQELGSPFKIVYFPKARRLLRARQVKRTLHEHLITLFCKGVLIFHIGILHWTYIPYFRLIFKIKGTIKMIRLRTN